MSSTKVMELSSHQTLLDGEKLQLIFYGMLDLNEILKIQESNWKEIIISFPRKKMDDFLKTSEEANYSGIYFLWERTQNLVYIGQASNEKLKQRLGEHASTKDWWNRCIFVTEKGNTLDAADLNYLESTFIEKAKKAGKELDNGTKGNKSGNISEEKTEKLNIFINNILKILEVTGIDIFSNKHNDKEIKDTHRKWSKTISKEKLFLEGRGCYAIIEWKEEKEIVVKKGSLLADTYQEGNLGENLRYEMKQYKDDIENKKVLRDISFESLNKAATFCYRGAINVWESLKNKDNKNLDEICEEIYKASSNNV